MTSSMMKGRVLAIAGSDSGGGAGIQADIKTITALNAYAASAVTALTVQDTQAVYDVHEVPAKVIADQIEKVLSDIGADAIKTGMLASEEIVTTVAASLQAHAKHIPWVIDPVMVAKGGHRLISENAVECLKTQIIAYASVVTPNLPEAEVLTGRTIKTIADMERAIESLRQLGAKAVLLKGGHVEGDCVVDLLITNKSVCRFEGPRLESSSTHGTGCTLASAVAAGIAQNLPLNEAVSRARAYVVAAIKGAPGFGQGHGPLNHAHTVLPFTGKNVD